MIHLLVIDVNLNVFNERKKRARELGKAHKEITVRTIRADGLLEEKSCDMLDFLNLFGYEVNVIGNKMETKDDKDTEML